MGESKQREYDPYYSTDRAAWEEFGDLLAEGLYARLDSRGKAIRDVDSKITGAASSPDPPRPAPVGRRIAVPVTRRARGPRPGLPKAAKSVKAAQAQAHGYIGRPCCG